METLCGATCEGCEMMVNKKCKGCINTDACPHGKKCWIATYIEKGGKESFEDFKKKVMSELNSLKIEGMPEIKELYPLQGQFINLEYQLPSGEKAKLLDDYDSYVGNQVECEFNNDEMKTCFGVAANANFLLICEYGEGGSNPEIVVFKRR